MVERASASQGRRQAGLSPRDAGRWAEALE